MDTSHILSNFSTGTDNRRKRIVRGLVKVGDWATIETLVTRGLLPPTALHYWMRRYSATTYHELVHMLGASESLRNLIDWQRVCRNISLRQEFIGIWPLIPATIRNPNFFRQVVSTQLLSQFSESEITEFIS